MDTEEQIYYLSYGNHSPRNKRDHIRLSYFFDTEAQALRKANALRFIQGYCVALHSGFVLGRSATGQPTSWSEETMKTLCSEYSPASCRVAHSQQDDEDEQRN